MLDRLLGRSGDDERLEEGLEKTRQGWLTRLAAVFGPVDITEATWQELEDQLILSDVGVGPAQEIIAELQREAREGGVSRADELPRFLHRVMVGSIGEVESDESQESADEVRSERAPGESRRAHVVMVVGVNGSGKTTSMAKLAALYQRSGSEVLMVVADTFRAAAKEQLEVWGERIGVPVLSGEEGGDPAAVVFDSLDSRLGRSADVVLIDTAGRLHTQKNLMAELEKVRRVSARVIDGAPHETLLVLDATTGQNGLMQARAFTDAVDVTGIILAKLDSSSKGGVALAVTRELGVKVQFVGTGEAVEDFAVFDADDYVAGLLGTRG